MTDIEVVALSLTAEFMSIDSENHLFKLIDASQVPNLIEKPVQQTKEKDFLFHRSSAHMSVFKIYRV